jgi:hypothetical protein
MSIRTNSGAVIAFSSIVYDQFAAHGSDVGLGPVWRNDSTSYHGNQDELRSLLG